MLKIFWDEIIFKKIHTHFFSATVNCGSGDGKKLCKKYKITFPPTANYVLKHYKDGEFHKNYDRLETVASMTTFLKGKSNDFVKIFH